MLRRLSQNRIRSPRWQSLPLRQLLSLLHRLRLLLSLLWHRSLLLPRLRQPLQNRLLRRHPHLPLHRQLLSLQRRLRLQPRLLPSPLRRRSLRLPRLLKQPRQSRLLLRLLRSPLHLPLQSPLLRSRP